MLTRDQYLQSLKHEMNVCKHLYTKLLPEYLEYRPTPQQRSTFELLQYLSSVAQVTTTCLINDDWSGVQQLIDQLKLAEAGQFCEAMDRQYETVERMVRDAPESDLTNRMVSLPMRDQKMPLGEALVNFPLKFMTAYKMQLFLYLKSCGRTELSTSNCWVGIDNPRPGG